jgi:hypothetical protein
MSEGNEVAYHEATQCYELPFGNLVVYAQVRKEKNTLSIDYVFAPPDYAARVRQGNL